MEEEIRQLKEKVKRLEDNQIKVIMSFNADQNILHSMQRTLTGNVQLGQGSFVMGNAPLADSTAIIELRSTTKGFLPPRMTTTQRNAITAPAEGLTIYNITTKFLEVYDGSGWTSYVTTSGTQTLTNKTLITPTIADFTNAQHNHEDAAGGGQLDASAVFDTGRVPTARLGTGTANSTTFLRGDQTWNTP